MAPRRNVDVASVLCLLLPCLCAFTEEPSDLLAEGNDKYARGELWEAKGAYERCLALDAKNAWCMTNLGSVLTDMHGEGSPEAEGVYRRAIQLCADDVKAPLVDTKFNLALLLQSRKDAKATAEAARLYREVVTADPGRWDAWSNYAAALHDLREDLPAAFSAYVKAIVLCEELQETGKVPAGALDQALAPLYLGYGTLLADADDTLCDEFMRADHVGVLLQGDGGVSVCRLNARNAISRALELDPGQPKAEHALAALAAAEGLAQSTVHVPDRASPEFVRALFDDFAPTFDEKLRVDLEYNAPELVAEEVARRGPFRSGVDAGCGTGLLGPLVRPYITSQLVGVDLSPRMLDVAAGLGVYDRLLVRDLLDLHDAPVVDLVAAADVFVYFGDLSGLMASLSRLLRPGGFLVFTCEALENREGWAMTPTGRYAHAKDYVDQQARAAGLALDQYRQVVPRKEKGADVQGHLFVYSREA